MVSGNLKDRGKTGIGSPDEIVHDQKGERLGKHKKLVFFDVGHIVHVNPVGEVVPY